LVKHLSQRQKLMLLPFLIERDGGYCCFYCKYPLSIETQVYDHLNSNPKDNRPENIVLSCQSCNVKKENDFDLIFLAKEKLRENELNLFVRKSEFHPLQKNQFHKVEDALEVRTEIDINQSNFEITKQYLYEKLAVDDSLEYTKTINNCAYICKEKTGYGSQQSVRNYIDSLTSEVAPFMISKNDEKKKIIVKRCDN